MKLRAARLTYLLSSLVAFLVGSLLSRAHDAPAVIDITPQAGITTPGSTVMLSGSGFLRNAVVYIDGLQARETKFVSDSSLEAVTPYLRPGQYYVQVKSGGVVVRSSVSFTALASPVDSNIDHALDLARQGQTAAAVEILTSIAAADNDFQVRAFAHYEMGRLFFAQGDWMHSAGESYSIWLEGAGMAPQTSWRYRLAADLATYFDSQSSREEVLRDFGFYDEYDVTQNPEPLFYRSVLNAQCGNLKKAKADSDFILRADPKNPSYLALAAYVAVLSGDNSELQSFHEGAGVTDARARRLLGEAS